jgi:hypothetical protein
MLNLSRLRIEGVKESPEETVFSVAVVEDPE